MVIEIRTPVIVLRDLVDKTVLTVSRVTFLILSSSTLLQLQEVKINTFKFL